MTRVASLYLPQLPIERLRRSQRSAAPPEPAPSAAEPRLPLPVDDNPGACSVRRGGGWRPGARWARDGALSPAATSGEIDTLPAPQRPSVRVLGRRSEPAAYPFRAMPPDEGSAGHGSGGEAAERAGRARPTVLIARAGQREIVTAACPEALALGLWPGMVAAHARALVADLDVREAEPGNDRALLDRLALHAALHWTPIASVSAPDGLWLDLTGGAHLFGGEARFCRRLLRFLQRLGFTARVAVAGTPGAAHALARYADDTVTLLPAGAEAQALADLPLAALRLAPEALTAASRFGLERIGDLYPMPRGPLARRLGLAAVGRLDQARGLAVEPIVPVVPVELPRAERRLLEPIATAEAIAQVMGDLVDDLVAALQARGEGLRAAFLEAIRLDGDAQRVAFGTARATRDTAHLKRMLAMRIERIEPGLGIEAMTLAALRVETLAPVALSAMLADEDRPADLGPLVDQLAGRAGEEALFRMGSVESDVPERAVRRTGALSHPPGWPAWKRPVRLLSRPERLSHVVALLPDHPPRRFVWRGQRYRVVAGDGPERIHGEWWRSAREMWAVRDYFRVEAEGGGRFWLFRRGDGVDAPTGDLTWYMHGMFG